VNVKIGNLIGKYIIQGSLGSGGMAEVYKAYDDQLNRPVALKLILPIRQLSKTSLRRFEREARTLAKLNYPNIVQILDVGDHDGQPYIVTDFIPGESLEQKIKSGKGKSSRMGWKEAARLLTPVARALAYAHGQGVVHRDVKPSNILVKEDGEPMLVDFGIAKLLEAEETIHLTGTGFGIGTPEYMAPEQCLGKEVGGRADVYSLGVVFYRLITGKVPYEGNTPMEVVMQHLYASLPEPGKQARGIPYKIQQVILKALAKKPEERFASMGEFAGVLENLAEGKLSQIRIPGSKPKNQVVGWALSLGMMAILVGLVWMGARPRAIAEQVTVTTTLLPTLNASEIAGMSPPQKTAYFATLSAQSTMAAQIPTPTPWPTITVTPTPTITLTPNLSLISLDGYAEDWQNINPILTDLLGDSTGDQGQGDITAAYLIEDENFVIIMIKVENGFPPYNNTIEIGLDLVSGLSVCGHDWEMQMNIRSNNAVFAGRDIVPCGELPTWISTAGSTESWNEVIEVRIPIYIFGEHEFIRIRYVGFWTMPDGGWENGTKLDLLGH
jgi:hypothetical protein